MSAKPEGKLLIIVTGGPGTGKSCMAARLMELISGLTMVSFDAIKEKNWDIFGFDGRQQKMRLNDWSLEEFYLTLQKRMWEQKNLLIEYPFNQRHAPKIQELVDAFGYRAVTVYLYTDLRQVYERGCERDSAGGRHPGHLLETYHRENFNPASVESGAKNYQSYEEFLDDITKKDYTVRIGKLISVDVHDFSKVSYEAIAKEILLTDDMK